MTAQKLRRAAKIASRGKGSAVDKDLPLSLVTVSGGGCRVSRNITGKTDCGRYMIGWRYGAEADVTCPKCREEIE